MVSNINISTYDQEMNRESTSSGSSDSNSEAEMRLYLDKLKQIVPQCPKNKKVSRLELIQHVIDYICDLQQALEERSGSLRHADMNFLSQQASQSALESLMKNGLTSRQPLGVLSQPDNIPHSRPLRQQQSRSSSSTKNIPFSSFFTGAENG